MIYGEDDAGTWQSRLVHASRLAPPERSASYTSNRNFLQSFERFRSGVPTKHSAKKTHTASDRPPAGRWKLTPLPSPVCPYEFPIDIHSKSKGRTPTSYMAQLARRLWGASAREAHPEESSECDTETSAVEVSAAASRQEYFEGHHSSSDAEFPEQHLRAIRR
ncbi:uncharacterized protein LOC111071937 [Drosophila obscura]|uniref:uncharacterized protein LOC111071937 n=1 Tax=Drosophila obscura TaxID=7282 RepID=UPI001BB2AC50|nr:uncharacterized protein LOC111071937 [Drosophila obscura]